MTSINSINVNAQGIGSSYGFNAKPKTEEKETEKKEVGVQSQKSQIPADEVFTYMAQSAVSVTPKNAASVDPARYVDEASANRIAGFMSSFEDKVAEGLAAFDKEFGPQVSDSAKMAVVLAGINKDK